ELVGLERDDVLRQPVAGAAPEAVQDRGDRLWLIGPSPSASSSRAMRRSDRPRRAWCQARSSRSITRARRRALGAGAAGTVVYSATSSLGRDQVLFMRPTGGLDGPAPYHS